MCCYGIAASHNWNLCAYETFFFSFCSNKHKNGLDVVCCFLWIERLLNEYYYGIKIIWVCIDIVGMIMLYILQYEGRLMMKSKKMRNNDVLMINMCCYNNRNIIGWRLRLTKNIGHHFKSNHIIVLGGLVGGSEFFSLRAGKSACKSYTMIKSWLDDGDITIWLMLQLDCVAGMPAAIILWRGGSGLKIVQSVITKFIGSMAQY